MREEERAEDEIKDKTKENPEGMFENISESDRLLALLLLVYAIVLGKNEKEETYKQGCFFSDCMPTEPSSFSIREKPEKISVEERENVKTEKDKRWKKILAELREGEAVEKKKKDAFMRCSSCAYEKGCFLSGTNIWLPHSDGDCAFWREDDGK